MSADKVTQLHQTESNLQVLEKELNDLRKEPGDLRKERSENLVQFIDKDPTLFVKLVCQGVLGIDTEEVNPFLVKLDEQSALIQHALTVNREMFGGFAKLLLNKIDGTEERLEASTDYLPFFDIVQSSFSGEVKWIRGEEFRECEDLISIVHTLFGRFGDEFGSAIDTSAHQIYEGLPLYRDRGDGCMAMVPFDDPLYVYIVKKGEFWETGSTCVLPSWVSGLYVKQADLDAYNAYFAGSAELSDKERGLRREALWTTLGITPEKRKRSAASTERRVHKTSMLKAVQAVVDRYYGAQFEDGNADTVPRQKDVVEWLMTTFELSKREAESVDVVTRPDFARK
ncbi:hypothetical protein PQQ88_01155 [Paraburkholderia caledonica]|uniref:hypothetical protein n=1 Tax=Paraburkholderia caledonica TaxID=134536 RepID=UPI0038B978C7